LSHGETEQSFTFTHLGHDLTPLVELTKSLDQTVGHDGKTRKRTLRQGKDQVPLQY